MSTWPSNQPPVAHITASQRHAWRKRFAASDQAASIEITEEFAPFNQVNDIFTRAFWDDTIRNQDTEDFFASYRMKATPRRGAGFTLKEFALRNAAWAVSDMVSERGGAQGKREGFQAMIELQTPVAEEQFEIDNSPEFTREIKAIAKLFGADLVGITEHDERWLYSARVDTRDFSPVSNQLPESISHVIVLGHAMDKALVDTYPSALAGVSTGLEYSHEAAIVIQLASYIRNLGYEAIASMNDTALVIPLAVKAGLGEYGRNQMVITPEFGPRLRFSKIFTSLPLTPDQPKRHGITEYCNICTKCAEQCPPKALPFGPPIAKQQNRSTIAGVKKWSADCEKCFSYWAKLKSDCAICMRVCPFNRDYSKSVNRIWRALAGSRLRSLAYWWDHYFPNGIRLQPKHWWIQLVRH